MTPPVVLSIAATDSGGGAGLAADLATFAALGVHGTCVVTAVTAQDTTGVHAIHPVPLDIVSRQLDAVLEDLRPAVIKTGVLGSAEVVHLVVSRFLHYRERVPHSQLVVDPVLRATTGTAFADEAVRRAYREALVPVATVVTPNEDEFVELGRPDLANVIVTRGGPIATTNDHGTGCTYASALAAHLAHGDDLERAARKAAGFVVQQLRTGSTWDLGRGRGPVAHVVSTSSTDRGELT